MQVERKKHLNVQKKVKECQKKLSKANTKSIEEKILKEIGLHKEEKMKEKLSFLCTGAKDWHKVNKILTGQIMDYEKIGVVDKQ